ncbi:hypothetical protein CLOM_g6686 [Closterium sp. NIES-68]|nr:hypothetical protein CLOM_g6686 [Closterium sp. NIES-68]GJP80842.1 hypothetical protein CLOP_g11042 [Closterium sp. NIES-67]
MASVRVLSLLLLVLVSAAAVAEARIDPAEFIKAIKAIRRSPRFKAASVPAAEALFRRLMKLDSSTGNVTLLVPAELAALNAAALPAFTLPQANKIRLYHLLSGLYTVADLQALPLNAKIATVEGKTMKKLTPAVIPVVMLKGRDLLPSVLVSGDVYVGDTLAVHVVSSILLPPDL